VLDGLAGGEELPARWCGLGVDRRRRGRKKEEKKGEKKKKGEKIKKFHVIVHVACHVGMTTVKRGFGPG
jgi:hypothetical protein